MAYSSASHKRSISWSNAFQEQGLQIGRFCALPGEHRVPELPVHLIGIHIGATVSVFQKRAGRSGHHQFVAGDVVIIPAGTPNLCAHNTPTDDLYLGIEPRLLSNTAEAIGADPGRLEILTNFGTQDVTLQSIAQALTAELEIPALGGTLYIESLLDQLAIRLMRTYSTLASSAKRAEVETPAHARPQLRRTLDFIHENIGADLSLKALAAVVNLSPYHFSRWFKQATGLPPHQYVIAQRVETAKQLLLNSPLTLAEVAAQVGFYDQSHFNYHFKRVFGVTPQGLRESKNLQKRQQDLPRERG